MRLSKASNADFQKHFFYVLLELQKFNGHHHADDDLESFQVLLSIGAQIISLILKSFYFQFIYYQTQKND